MKIKLFTTLALFIAGALFSTEKSPTDHHLIVAKSADETTSWKLELLKNAERRIYMMTGYAEGNILANAITIFEESLAKKPELKIWFFISTFVGLNIEESTNRAKALVAAYPGRFHLLIKGASDNYSQAEGRFNTENHIKVVIADEKYAIIGGTNLLDNLSREDTSTTDPTLSAHFTPKGALDQDVLFWGPSAASLKSDFFRVWGIFAENGRFENNLGPFYPTSTEPASLSEEEKAIIPFFETHKDRIYPVKAKALITGPRINPHAGQKEYENLIEKASRDIQIGHLYFFPIDSIFDKLMNAANRGIAIQAMTNGFWKDITLKESSLWFYVQRSRVHYLPLLMGRKFTLLQSIDAKTLPQKNVTMYELNENYMLYHKKVMTVDGTHAIVGSFNFGKKSAYSDYEAVVVIESAKAVSEINAILAQDFKRGTNISRDVAYSWYYNPYYYLASDIQEKMTDGIMLSMKKVPKPTFIEPPSGELEQFLIMGTDPRSKRQ